MGTELLRLYMSLLERCNKLFTKADHLMTTILHEGLAADFIDTIFLPCGGQLGPIRFINTCVPDSFLMALYNCYIQHDHIASFFNSSRKLMPPMVFLRKRMYNEAKASWLFWNLAEDTFKEDTSNVTFVTDAWSEPRNHLHMFFYLTVSNEKLSKFDDFGDVYALGYSDINPLLILVDIKSEVYTAPPGYIEDDYYRTFELNFLLMSKSTHMTAVLNLFDRWVLYDDLKLSYENFKPNKADFKEEFKLHFAGYINIQNNHNKYIESTGVLEEGYGTVPFNPSRDFSYKKEHLE